MGQTVAIHRSPIGVEHFHVAVVAVAGSALLSPLIADRRREQHNSKSSDSAIA